LGKLHAAINIAESTATINDICRLLAPDDAAGLIGSAQSTRRRVLDSRQTGKQTGKAVNQQAIAAARTSRQSTDRKENGSKSCK
jgi:hypothetical protein